MYPHESSKICQNRWQGGAAGCADGAGSSGDNIGIPVGALWKLWKSSGWNGVSM